MGLTLVPVPFFTLDIEIKVVDTNVPRLCGRRIRLGRFAEGHPVSLSRIPEFDEYLARLPNGEFIQGPATTPRSTP